MSTPQDTAKAQADALLAAADNTYDAAIRKARRIPRARREERNDLFAAADSAYAVALREVRSWQPGTPEFRAAHPNFDRTGQL